MADEPDPKDETRVRPAEPGSGEERPAAVAAGSAGAPQTTGEPGSASDPGASPAEATQTTRVSGSASEPPAGDPATADRGPVNQGATGSRPLGESPLSVESEQDSFAERPELFVGAAFAGGLVLALILRRIVR